MISGWFPPVKAQDVADATGLDKGEVSKLISSFKKEGKVVSPNACFYELVQ